MKKNIVVAAIFSAIILIGISLYYLSSSPSDVDNLCLNNPRAPECLDEENNEEIQRIMSNDGSAELIIPAESLPNNVEFEDISVSRISDNQLEDPDMIEYNLEPDGLKFTDEILLQISLEIDEGTIPLVFVSTNTGVELVNDTRIEVDPENKQKIVNVPLTHFSGIFLSKSGSFQIKASAQDTTVGNLIDTTGSFTLLRNNIIIPGKLNPSEIIKYEIVSSTQIIRGFWVNSHVDPISPVGTFGGYPENTQILVKQTITADDDLFYCKAPTKGRIYLRYFTELYMNIVETRYASENDYLDGNASSTKIKDNHFIRSDAFAYINCLPEEVVDDDPPLIDPDDLEAEPNVEVSFEHTYSQQVLVSTSIYVNITGVPDINGNVTLIEPNFRQTQKRFIINNQGQAPIISFIVSEIGEYTVIVNGPDFVISKRILVKV
ncbi:MAG: hypothetical protein ACW99Q_16400 [Candidatus Kariarchaeaceae archaeon]|jgi:hypothetical protein